MKRVAWLFLISTLVIFSLPVSPSGAFGAEMNFAPGSVIRFEHLTIEDGLSQNAGMAIFQDSRGYLWIGTQDGLNRYDGYQFKVFKHDPDDPTTISHNSILSMGEDRYGSLWIGTWGGGLNRYDPSTETFTRYLYDPEDPSSISSETVTSIRGDSNGTLWIGTLAGLNRYNPETDTFEHFKHDPANSNSLSSEAISYIFEDSNHQLWIGTGATGVEGSGLNRFDPSTGTFTLYQHDDADPESLASNNIASIVETPDGKLWIATGGFSLHGGGLDRFDPQTGKAEHFVHDQYNIHSLSGDDLMSMWLDPEGTLWVGAWANGLNRMNLSQPGYFTRYHADPFFPDSLSGDEVWALFRDRSGILWVGTSHSGINKLPSNAGQFSLYRNNPSDLTSLSINATGAFAEDKRGSIWIATWGGGLDRFDPNTGIFVNYHHDPANPNSLSDDLFMDVYVDSFNTVWAGTLGKGLNRLEPTTGRVTHYHHDPENPASLADDNIAAIIPGKNNDLWIGTFGGLSHYDAATDSFINYSNDPANPASLNHNMVVNLYIDSKGILWMGTWGGGLNRLDLNDPLHTDPKTATFTNYIHQADNSNSLSEDSVWSIHETADGFIWLGTQLGLNRLDPQSGEFKHYNEKDGLPNNVVLGILEDDDTHLWLTTNNGLAEFDRPTETFTLYDSSDGLQSNEFNSNAYYKSKDGTMYVGGINGFNLFHPEDIKPNPVAPQVVVTRFDVFNEPMKVDLTGGEPIQLTHDQNFISFEFSAFDFQAPQKNNYAYKLEGFDENWIQAGDRRYVTYTNLPGGEYIFRVKAANSDGVWNKQGVSIPVVITPPFWQTWWFLGSLILVLSAVVAGGFRLRLNSIREKNVFLETQVAERTSELRETNKILETEVEQRKRAEAELANRAARELQQSEERFRITFEKSAIGIALVGLDRIAHMVNPAIVQMTGYSEQELLGMSGLELIYPEDRRLAAAPMMELTEGRRETFQSESRFVRKNGQVFWVRQTISVVRGLDGRPLYLVVMVEDIDEQKRNLASLRESEAQFRAMFESSAMGVVILDLEKLTVQYNQIARQLLDNSDKPDTLNDPYEFIHIRYREHEREQFTELMKGLRDSYTCDRCYHHPGEEEIWSHVTISTVRDIQGEVRYIVAMMENVTEQKKDQQRLLESEARFQAIFNNVAVGVAVMTLERRPMSFNSATERIIGYSADELRDTDPRLLAVPEDREIDVDLFNNLIEGKRNSYVMERRYRHKDGRIFWARVNYSLVRDLDGKPDYLVVIIEDIDEQKRAAERMAEQEADYLLMLQERVQERTKELEDANLQLQKEIEQRTRIENELAEKAAEEAVTADRTRLARDLHDAVTQTLFSASLTAEVLPDLWDMDVDEAKKSTEELRQLTRGALAEMRTLLLELRPAALTQTRLSDLIKQLCEAFIGRSRLPITLSIDGDRELPPEVQVAVYRIAQESLNNVFKYARATQVNVSLFLFAGGLRFEVCDNGIGFDMTVSKPTSLGMRIMRERAEAIGADFHVSSTPGSGTCVEVTWNANPNMKLRVL